jgi:hypothetical protein
MTDLPLTRTTKKNYLYPTLKICYYYEIAYRELTFLFTHI